MIEIRQPLSFSEIGKKDNQEDYLYPQHADTNTRVFILCDGMGGHDNGEVASKTAAKVLGGYLSQFKEIDISTFEAGLAKAYDALDPIDTHSARKPGTTMTCLCLNENNYLVAHIGDSRIYHIRRSLFNPKTGRGGILYQSSDHSLINDLLKAGEITEQEASVFPQKNVITKAMQPHLERRYKADVYQFNDIATGDYFFLCSDGVLEQLSNQQLCKILATPGLSEEDKLSLIKSKCDGLTRDNYTCWLIPVSKAEIKGNLNGSNVIVASEFSSNYSNAERAHESKTKADAILSSFEAEKEISRKRAQRVHLYLDLTVLVLTLLAILVWFILKLTNLIS